MSVETASAILGLIGIYFAIGGVFGLAFITLGAKRVDPAASSITWGARLLILPGSAALWPLLLLRWITRKGPPVS